MPEQHGKPVRPELQLDDCVVVLLVGDHVFAAGLNEGVVVEEEASAISRARVAEDEPVRGVDHEDPVVAAVGDHQIAGQAASPGGRFVGRGGPRLGANDVGGRPQGREAADGRGREWLA